MPEFNNNTYAVEKQVTIVTDIHIITERVRRVYSDKS